MGSSSPFTIMLLNQFGGVVLVVQRIVACCNSMCGGTCGNEVIVETGTGQLVGKILQDDGFCEPKLSIYDASNMKVLSVQGPSQCCQFFEVNFQVMDLTGNVVGEIHKQWGGYLKEMYTSADNFGVAFPPNMDPGIKVLLLAVVFLLDFMFFENQPNRNNNSGGGFHSTSTSF